MSNFAAVSRSVAESLNVHVASVDRDAEWQRVNSYIADVLKDAHVLYAKLARLQGDFGGNELTELEKISEGVLGLGGKLSEFSKGFYDGKSSMTLSDVYGEEDKSIYNGQDGGTPFSGGGSSAPAMDDFSPAASEPALDESEPVDMDFDYAQD